MEIWIGRDGERHGPYQDSEVRAWLRSGEIAGDDLGWHEGLADWRPLSTLFPDDVAPPRGGTPPPFAATAPRPAPASVPDSYAGFWKRLLAYLIDAIVLYIPNQLIMNAMGTEAAQTRLTEALQAAAGNLTATLDAYSHFYSDISTANLVTTVVAWLYFAFCESSAWQGTIGKLALGIRVTDLHGARISLPRALGRYPAKFFSAIIFCIGFLMIGWTQRKQGLHDMICSTLVLNGRAGEARRSDGTGQAGPAGRLDA